MHFLNTILKHYVYTHILSFGSNIMHFSVEYLSLTLIDSA